MNYEKQTIQMTRTQEKSAAGVCLPTLKHQLSARKISPNRGETIMENNRIKIDNREKIIGQIIHRIIHWNETFQFAAYRLGWLSLITVILALSSSAALAQDGQYSNNKADQTLRSSGRVNPSTLGLEMNIPLAGYPGRGINVPISLSYSSKVWRVKYNTDIPDVNTSTCYSANNVKYGENSASGWTSSLGAAYVEYTGETNLFNEHGHPWSDSVCSTESNDYNAYVKRVEVHLPSGEAHELRAADAPILYPSNSNPSPLEMTGTYYSVDGSKLKYVDDGNGTCRLYLPDGSTYDFAGAKVELDEALIRKATLYKDTSGNQLTFNAPDANYPNGSWTDTLGRTIPIPLSPTEAPSAPTAQNYQLPGITNPYKFYWKQLKGATAAESALTDFNQSLKYKASASGYNNVGIPNYRPAQDVLFHSSPGEAVTFDAPGDDAPFNPVVLAAIELPNGQKYQFSYNIYGEIEKIIYPTGGEERFTLGQVLSIGGGIDKTPQREASRGVTRRAVYENANATPAVWSYATATEGNNFKVTTNEPDATHTERVMIPPIVCLSSCPALEWGFNTTLAGMPAEERAYSSTGGLLSKKLTSWTQTDGTTGSYGGAPERHPRVTKEESIIYDPATGNALSSSMTMDYAGDLNQIDNPVNVSRTSQYGFTTSIGSLGSLQKSVETDYLNDANYLAANLKSLPIETRIKDAAGNVQAKSQIVYDESGYGNGTRGQPTTSRSWTDIVNNQFVETHAKYDSYGNVIQSTDAKGNITTTEYSSAYQYAYPTKVTSPIPDATGANGSQTAFQTTTTYDLTTGLPLTTTDANGQTASMEYNDALLRPTRIIPPSGGAITEMIYTDTPGAMAVKTRSQIDATNWAESTVYADGLGRAVKSEKKDNAGNVFVETQYDNMGRVSQVSNPYRSGDAVLWTQNTYDGLSRVTKIKTPDNAEVNTAFDVATSGTFGTVVTVTDQAGKVRRSLTNALGQLSRVDEPDDNGNLGAVASPNQATNYLYDTLNNLTTVNQGVQQRTFQYDSLSRLKSAVNPESGTIAYSYDNNGNLTGKTDARSIATTYGYDNLNRVKTRSYSDSTPAVNYFYDNLQNARGKLIKVSSTVSETRYNSFDNLGRVLTSQQLTDGQTYNFAYQYNLAGMLLSETYPSGRVVSNQFDADGDLSQLAGLYNQVNKTYADSFAYTAAGAVSSMKLGNNRWENAQFNNRLQPAQLGLGSAQNQTDLWKVNYDYGTTDNNGNVKGQTITVPSINPLIQTYSYDSLNRLKSAQETSNGNQTWKQTFVYDRYGNRNFDANNTTTLGSCPPNQCNPTVDVSNNRFTTGQGYTYDLSGNLITDAQNRSFIYDAENKQKEVKDGNNQSIGQYFYDGDGKRVKKISSADTTVFVYDASGKMTAEYLLTVLIPSAPTTSYLTSDTLGSPRVITDQSGNVTSRRDFMPFGEEIAGLGNRASTLGYQADSLRQKFTGYQRDSESNLDFAEARYHNFNLGRFNSPDPYNIVLEIQVEPDKEKTVAKLNTYLGEVQQWNRYAYVANNPLKYVDPSGEIIYLTGTAEDQAVGIKRLREQLGEKRFSLLSFNKKTVEGIGEVTEVGFSSQEKMDKFLAIGKGGENDYSIIMGRILGSGEITEYRVAEIFQIHGIVNIPILGRTDFGIKTIDAAGSYCGGACTVNKDESLTGNVQIFVHPRGANIARNALAPLAVYKSSDGEPLEFTNDIVDAHEFGHAYNAIRGRLVDGSYWALQMENIVRARHPELGNRTRINH